MPEVRCQPQNHPDKRAGRRSQPPAHRPSRSDKTFGHRMPQCAIGWAICRYAGFATFSVRLGSLQLGRTKWQV